MKETDRGTWIDQDGQYADPGTEFIFDPREKQNTKLGPEEGPKQHVKDSDIENLIEETGKEQASLEPDTFDENLDDRNGEEYLMKDGKVVG